MEAEFKPNRNELGDITSPNIPETFWQEIRDSRWTYVFHFRHTDGHFFEVDYEKFEWENMRTDLPKMNLVKYKLFEGTNSGTDEWFNERNLLDSYVSRFFGPVLRNRNEPTDISKVDYFTLVIPVEKLAVISKFIVDFGLNKYKDFILYLIAKIEEVFIRDVDFFDRPEQRKKIKSLPKEVDNFHKVLKWSQPTYGPEMVTRPELQHVVFHYNTVPPIKISEHLLFSNLTTGAINYLDGASRKNWEKQLKAMPSIFTANQLPNEFRPRISKALHYFFKEVKAFEFGPNKITNKEVEAIARILDFAWVPFRNNKSDQYDINDDTTNIIAIVKKYIERKELVYNKSHYTVNEFKPDFEALKKYFDNDLLMYGRPVFEQEELLQVLTITDRFDCNQLFPNLIYLFSCLKAKSFQIGHQFECCINKEVESNHDYQSWQKMFEIIDGKDSLSKLTFIANNEVQEFSFSEQLSTELIMQALKEYYKNNKFEFEVDFYESIVQSGGSPGSFKVVTTGKLHNPQNRFFAKFTKACYRFLLEQFPPIANEYKPSEKYFLIIALLLQESYFLTKNQWPEDFLLEKVTYWYNLK